MDTVSFAIGSKLHNKKTDAYFRVLNIASGLVLLSDMSTTKSLKLENVPTAKIFNWLEKNLFEIITEEPSVVDTTLLPENVLKKYNAHFSLITEMEKVFSSDYFLFSNYKNRDDWSRLCKEYKLSKDQIKRIYVRFLNSGKQFSSLLRHSESEYVNLLNGKKRGRNNTTGYKLQEKDIKNFDVILKSYKKNPVSTLIDAYKELIIKFYSNEICEKGIATRVKFPPEMRPSYRQFYYYYSKAVPEKDRLKKRMGAKDYRNNKRVFTGSAMDNVLGPGDIIEMDAHELDISMVSQEYPDGCVGRPILYLMIDVYTRMILAVSVALDNNSVVAATNCFMNLVKNKTELLQEFNISFEGKNGITIDDIWPSYVCPNRLRFDHGADFTSNEITRIVDELGIAVDHVTPGMGSLKPIVERIFGDIEKQIKTELLDKGLIRKVYNSNHHAESCLDINDVMFIILNYVLVHNQRYMESYQLPVTYIEKGIKPIPTMLWREGTKRFQPRRLPVREQFLYSILTPCTAKINREGIIIDNLKYLNTDNDTALFQQMQKQGKTKAPFPVRRDMRDVSRIYYLRDGKLMQACLDPLNPVSRSYYGISVSHYEKLMKIVKENDRAGRENNLELDINMKLTCENVVKSAKKRKGNKKTDTKHMRENREREKNIIQVDNSVATQFNIEPKGQQPPETINTPSETLTANFPTFSDTDTAEEIAAKRKANARKMFD